jgi:hypothetical protein
MLRTFSVQKLPLNAPLHDATIDERPIFVSLAAESALGRIFPFKGGPRGPQFVHAKALGDCRNWV